MISDPPVPVFELFFANQSRTPILSLNHVCSLVIFPIFSPEFAFSATNN